MTIVLGGGPVGLVAAYINKADYCVTDRDPSAPVLRSWAPTYIWRSAATIRLLDSLGMSWKPRDVRVAFISRAGVAWEASAEDRVAYYARSRATSLVASEVPSSAMSDGLECIETFDVGMDDLVKSLMLHVRIRRATAIGVSGDSTHVVLDLKDDIGELRVHTTRLINTLPAPVFDKISGNRHGREWPAVLKTFVLGSPEMDLRGVHYAYVTDPTIPYDRVNVLPTGACVYEFNGSPPDPEFISSVYGRVVFSGEVQVIGEPRRLISDPRLPIIHVGRFARWNRDRLHDVAEQMYKLSLQ